MDPQKNSGKKDIINEIGEIVRFQCPICFNQYNDKTRYPMIVCASQHYLCKLCAQTIIFAKSNTAKCPECRAPIHRETMVQFRYLNLIKKVSDEHKQKGSQITHQLQNKLNRPTDANKNNQQKNNEKRMQKYQKQLLEQQQLIRKLQEQNKKLLQKKSTNIKCKNNHLMSETFKLFAPYQDNIYECDKCKHTKQATKEEPVWHCKHCLYDLCQGCSKSSQSNSNHTSHIVSHARFCDSGHKLKLEVNLQLPYTNNQYFCNKCYEHCATSDLAPVLHCSICNFDICPQCAEN